MPIIKSSDDLRNSYDEISALCHACDEPVFIAKNGEADLAVMSMECYEQIVGRAELYVFLQDGMQDVREGRTRPFSDVMTDIRSGRE